MSDLYLVLRRRLSDVAADWAELGTETLRDARNLKGYSYEGMGRLLNVSGKTYERYEKGGRVPRHLLPKVAEVLDLELVEAPRVSVSVTPPAADANGVDVLDRILAELEAIRQEEQQLREQLSGLQATLDALANAQDPPEAV